MISNDSLVNYFPNKDDNMAKIKIAEFNTKRQLCHGKNQHSEIPMTPSRVFDIARITEEMEKDADRGGGQNERKKGIACTNSWRE